MGMVVRTNTMAINANRQLGMNNSAVAKSLEKLSSGFKINRAGDDASGLAVSEKMKAQIKGLEQASANAQDGISLIQTAEGNLTEVHDMLNRMVELAEKSANGILENVDRDAIQDEMDALSQEIDRIADSANFNNIKLFDGSRTATTTTAATAFTSTDPSAKTDGQTPTAATKATYTIKLDGTNATAGGIAITGGTTTITQLGALTANGQKLSDLFDVKIDGAAKDWTTDAATVIGSGAKIELVAKVAGELVGATHSALMGITGAASLTGTNGTAEGAGSAATKSAYKLDFDFTKLADGQTFKIGDKTFEISTDGTKGAGSDVLIDLKGLDLTVAGGDNTKGQWGAAKAIRDAVNTAFGSDFDVDAVVTAAPTGDKFTLNFTAKAAKAGDAGNLGAVRVSEAAAGAIKGTYTAGEVAGAAQPGTFATVSYDFDPSKLAEGDTLQIGSTKIEVVADADEDILNGKIGATKAKTAAELVKAFESNGYTSGKIEIAGGKLKITGTAVGQTGADLADNAGKITYTTNGGGTTVSGGLKLQIGDTNDDYNKLQVSMDDMHMSALFDTKALTDSNYSGSLGIGTAVLKDAGASKSLDVRTQDNAGAALKSIRTVIDKVSTQRGKLGAIQNRLEHTINNLDVTNENMTAANSRIRDTDMAKEMMNYTKMNVLVQSAQAMLAQANQQPQSILQLLQ